MYVCMYVCMYVRKPAKKAFEFRQSVALEKKDVLCVCMCVICTCVDFKFCQELLALTVVDRWTPLGRPVRSHAFTLCTFVVVCACVCVCVCVCVCDPPSLEHLSAKAGLCKSS